MKILTAISLIDEVKSTKANAVPTTTTTTTTMSTTAKSNFRPRACMRSDVQTFENMKLSFITGQRGKPLLVFDQYTYARNNEGEGNRVYWNCRSRCIGQVPCKARLTTVKQENGLYKICVTKPEHNHTPSQHECSVAVYAATSRGRVQLIYGGQPFIFEKILKLATGEEKKFWRCNQWWNQKCRSRVFTINDMVTPLNRYHTHEEIVKRKKRVRKQLNDSGNNSSASKKERKPIITTTHVLDQSGVGVHMKYEEIIADVTEFVTVSDLEKKH